MNQSTDLSAAPFRDPARPIAERVTDLLARMTLDEKLAQLGSVWVYELFTKHRFDPALATTFFSQGIGQITRIGGASSLRPQDSAELANTIQQFLIDNTRLGIPALVHEETCSGYMARGATCFPQAIGVASTWVPELAEQMGQVIRQQMRSVGAHQALAPVLDITRDPRWGRVEETFGEDPYLTARLGTSFVLGLQSDDVSNGIIATGKHFLGYGLSEGGMNWAPAHIPERELREVFAFPFEAAIRIGKLQSMMNAYHELDGVPCGASPWLLGDFLHDQLGFDGLVVSDYFAIHMLEEYHHVAETKAAAATLALQAGIDVELPSTNCYGSPLREALQDSSISVEYLDRAVSRILTMKFRMGLFENPFVDPQAAAAVFDTPEQRRLAYTVALKAAVLLKNDQLLPLSKELQSIAVIGPNADNVRNQMGDYSYPAHIETLIELQEQPGQLPQHVPDSSNLTADSVPMVSVLAGIKRVVGPECTVRYAKGCEVLGNSTEGFAEAVAAAQASEVAVVVVGDKAGLTDSSSSGEARDRAVLGLPGVQEDLVRAIAATGTPIVLVLMNGRPLTLSWLAEQIPAILEVWLPGEEGGSAIADLLFGHANPGGKLPMSFPRAVGQIPVYYNHKPSGGRSHWKGDYVELSTKPLFPFGYGLSYTSFDYSDLQLDQSNVTSDDTVNISVTIRNSGERSGDEVVQLYTHDLHASITRPVKELKGFQRITLEPGESRRVTFQLAVRQLGFYDQQMRYVVEPGTIEVMIGSSSQDIRLSSSIQIVGATTAVEKVFFSSTTVQTER